MRLKLFPFLLALFSCAPSPESTAPALDVAEATATLTSAYLQEVNPDGRHGSVRCDHKAVDSQNFVLCVYPSAGADPIHRGLWIAEQNGSSLKFYAVNGKALTALDKLDQYKEFTKQPDAYKIDISSVLERF